MNEIHLHAGETVSFPQDGTYLVFQNMSLEFYAQTETSRHFLLAATSGLLFPFKTKHIIIFSPQGGTLVQYSSEEIQQAPFFKEALERWIETLYQTSPRAPVDRLFFSLKPGTFDLDAGQDLIYTQEKGKSSPLLWVSIIEGEGYVIGEEKLLIKEKSPPFPVHPKGWIFAKTKLKIQVSTTDDLIAKNEWQQAVDAFGSLLAIYLHMVIEKEISDEKKVLKERKEESDLDLKSAIATLRSVLSPVHGIINQYERDPLLSAISKIAEKMGLSFQLNIRFDEHASLKEKIKQICELSSIQVRQVRLRPGWSKTGAGVLLGHLNDVAIPLFSNSLRGYQTIYLGKEQPVTQKMEQEISDTAFMFYRTFPQNAKTGFDVLQNALRGSWKLVGLFALFSVSATLFTLFPAIATRLLFSYAILESSVPLVAYLTGGILFSAVGFAILTLFRNQILIKIQTFVFHRIQTALWDRLLQLPTIFFKNYTVGNLFWRVQAVEEIQNKLDSGSFTTIANALFSILYLALMAYFSFSLGLLTFVLAALSLLITAYFSVRKLGFVAELMEHQGALRGILFQMIFGISKIRVAGSEKSAFSYFSHIFAKNRFFQRKTAEVDSHGQAIATLFPLLSIWIAWFAMILTENRPFLSLADFLGFSIALSYFSTTFYPIIPVILQFCEILPAWKRTMPILDTKTEVLGGKGVNKKLNGEILIDQVVFGYDPNSPPVLNQLSLKILPREFVGIVGRSGCGKSTLARLILGFETPKSGAIYYDGQDISSLNIRSLRRQIGTVMQGEKIGGGSLYSNLVVGGTYTEDEIKRALQLSGFEKDLETLPMGLFTYLPMDAPTLSGGQKQRLLLARALLSNPPLLILDEATSALDNVSQEEISEQIANLNTTRVVIAQRLSTLKKADRIIVIDHGKTIETGTFQELATQKGMFWQMLQRQKI